MKTDILIIGSGIAGLNFALESSKFYNVTLITKKKINDSNTEKAQGGMASVLSKDDSFEKHIKDTLKAGDGICNKKAVELVVKNSPNQIKKLLDLGLKFEKFYFI